MAEKIAKDMLKKDEERRNIWKISTKKSLMKVMLS
jgi:hypothetical protein